MSSKRAGCQLKLINLTPRVKELLSITRLFDVLESHAKEEMFGYTPDSRTQTKKQGPKHPTLGKPAEGGASAKNSR